MLNIELADPFVRGDDEVVAFQMVDATGVPIDISDRTYRASLKAQLKDTAPAATFAISVDLETAEVICDVDRSITAGLQPRPFYWMDLEETVTGGDRTTIIRAKVPLLADVTQ